MSNFEIPLLFLLITTNVAWLCFFTGYRSEVKKHAKEQPK